MKNIKELFKNRMQGTFNKKILYNIIILFFSIANSVLSVYLIPINENTNFNFEIYVTIIGTFIASMIFGEKILQRNLEYFKKNKILSFIILVFSVIIIRKIDTTKISIILPIIPGNIRFIFSHVGMILAIVSCYFILNFLVNKGVCVAVQFFNTFDAWEKRAYLIVSSVTFLLIIIVYGFNSEFYLQYDRILSMDTGWVFDNMISKINYYDIRHPFSSVFYFPIYSVVEVLVNNFFVTSSVTVTIKAIIFQVINCQLLIIIGFYLKKLTNNKNVFILYMLSFPTLTYFLFFEKYQLCVFLLVTYVFLTCTNKNGNLAFIASMGMMPVSGAIGIIEFLKKCSIKEKFINLLKIASVGVIFTIVIGKVHIFKYGINEALLMKGIFSNFALTFQQKIYSTFNMIQSTIISVSTNPIDGSRYWWSDIINKLPLLGIIIMIVLVIGFITNRKQMIAKVSLYWIFFSFVLFTILNWSSHESPLFNIYFSWATIVLFVYGIDYIIKKLKLNKKVVYGLMYAFIVLVNLSVLIDIYAFLL